MITPRNFNKCPAYPIPTKLQRGIVLLESLIALLIFSMGVLAIAGLQAAMVKGTTEAKIRSDASLIAQRRVAMMWANPANLASFEEVDSAVPELPNGLRSTVVGMVSANAAAVVVTITWQTPGEAAHRYSTNANIAGAT